MKFITVTELRQQLLQIVSEIEATKQPVAITKKGKPVVLMQFVTDEAFEPTYHQMIEHTRKLKAEIARMEAELAKRLVKKSAKGKGGIDHGHDL